MKLIDYEVLKMTDNELMKAYYSTGPFSLVIRNPEHLTTVLWYATTNEICRRDSIGKLFK